MGRIIRFIHTADLHLGSMLNIRNKVNEDLKEIFDKAVYASFEKICSTAIELKVDFILISGDIYDREARSVRANSFFAAQCRRLEENAIKVFAIGGNHDPISKNSELFSLPSNVHIMSPEEAEAIEVKDEEGRLLYRIIGQSYKENWENRKMYKNYTLPKDEILNVALLHTQLDGSSSYIPCYASDLLEIESIVYWALGHIHKLRLINKSPVIAYPGIPQGRDFGEEGLGGALVVEAEENKISSISCLQTSEVIWTKLNINLKEAGAEAISNVSDLENYLCSQLEKLIEIGPIPLEEIKIINSSTLKGYAVKLAISGRSELYHMLNDKDEELSQYLVDSLNNRFNSKRPFIYIDSIDIRLGRPIENLEELMIKNNTLRELSQMAKLCIEDKDIKNELIKKLGNVWELAEAYEDANIMKLQLSESLLEEIVKQAQQLAIDELLQRSEEL